ncbi:MAG: hypothetical protein LUG99_19975 [Lachnospiraceae bacterium]|nr:hypothetical protein [Lachnospiraceae bacterium]
MRLGNRDYEEPPEGKMYHSRLYHRHFEGYRETVVTKANGKQKIRRIYTAPYYHCDLSKASKVLLRLWYLLLTILASIFSLYNGLSDAAVNLVWYTALPQAVLVPVYLWSAYTLLYYIFTFRDMTIGDYRTSSTGLQKTFFALFLIHCVWFVGSVLFYIIHYGTSSPSAMYLIRILLSAAACIIISATESRIPYSRIENPASTAGVEIK